MPKSSSFRGVTFFRPSGRFRAQISASGKTTSLGDHDTEEAAARAFDRAAINKHGLDAKTNFEISSYDPDEVEELQNMTQAELVAMLRSKARKSGAQTSLYRGVSLLKQTGKWHAQINVGGKQVHLGFFSTEDQAARAYDRAAINKGARDNGKITVNFPISDYTRELETLRRITQEELVAALANEQKRRAALELLNRSANEDVFGRATQGPVGANDLRILQELSVKAERAAPKPTAASLARAGHRIAAGRPTSAASGSAARAAGPSARQAAPPARKPAKRRAREASVSSPDEDEEDRDDEDLELSSDTESEQRPRRKSTRRTAPAPRLQADESLDDELPAGEEADAPSLHAPASPPATTVSSPRLLPEHSSQAKLQAELLGTGPEPSGFELSPATPPSVKGRTLPVTTPQSKPRALHFATPAAAITAAAVASGAQAARPLSALSDTTTAARPASAAEARSPARKEPEKDETFWRSEQLQERLLQGKPVSKRQEAMMAAKAQKLAQQAAPQETTSPETSGQTKTSDAANLQASDSELGSDDEDQDGARKKELHGKSRRTIRRPERAT